ncbi:hypothetical protein [Nocardioides marmoraquaticus]
MALRGIVNRLIGGAGGRRSAHTGGAGGPRVGAGAPGGRRSQDEAIGRGVRSLLSRLRR